MGCLSWESKWYSWLGMLSNRRFLILVCVAYLTMFCAKGLENKSTAYVSEYFHMHICLNIFLQCLFSQDTSKTRHVWREATCEKSPDHHTWQSCQGEPCQVIMDVCITCLTLRISNLESVSAKNEHLFECLS